MADLYAAANQDSGVSSYISAASPAPSTGFGHSLGVSTIKSRTFINVYHLWRDVHIKQKTWIKHANISKTLSLLQGSFDCHGIYQRLSLKTLQGTSSTGRQMMMMMSRASAVLPVSFSLFFTNISFRFHPFLGPWRINMVKNYVVWLYTGKRERNFILHCFYLTSFSSLFCFFAECVWIFLLYSCCNGWSDGERERAEKHIRSVLRFLTVVNNHEQIYYTKTGQTCIFWYVFKNTALVKRLRSVVSWKSFYIFLLNLVFTWGVLIHEMIGVCKSFIRVIYSHVMNEAQCLYILYISSGFLGGVGRGGWGNFWLFCFHVKFFSDSHWLLTLLLCFEL